MFPRYLLSTVVIMFVLLVAACGGDGDEDELASVQSTSDSPAVEPDVDEEVDEPAMDADVGGEDAERSRSGAAQISADAFDRRVIRSAELELYVTDVRAAVRHARELAADYGGHVDSSSSRSLEDEEFAELLLEVPSSDFDTVLDALRDSRYVETVEHESTSSRDVTEEFVDLQSRLANLESTEIRFVSLLDEADTIDEVLNVERELSRIRGDIEQIQGRINYLEQRTSYSKIHVAFYPVAEEEESDEIVAPHFTPGETAREAWNASMQVVGTVGNVIIAAGVFFWWAWPLLAISALVFLHYRRRKGDVVTSG